MSNSDNQKSSCLGMQLINVNLLYFVARKFKKMPLIYFSYHTSFCMYFLSTSFLKVYMGAIEL